MTQDTSIQIKFAKPQAYESAAAELAAIGALTNRPLVATDGSEREFDENWVHAPLEIVQDVFLRHTHGSTDSTPAEPKGIWILLDSGTLVTAYPTELDALRALNIRGHGHASFLEYGEDFPA